MNVGNVSDFSFDKKGNYLAWIIDAQIRSATVSNFAIWPPAW